MMRNVKTLVVPGTLVFFNRDGFCQGWVRVSSYILFIAMKFLVSSPHTVLHNFQAKNNQSSPFVLSLNGRKNKIAKLSNFHSSPGLPLIHTFPFLKNLPRIDS